MAQPGRPVEGDERITITVDSTDLADVDELAKQGGISRAKWIRNAIAHCLHPRTFAHREPTASGLMDKITIETCAGGELESLVAPKDTITDLTPFGYPNLEWIIPSLARQDAPVLPSKETTK